MTLRTVNRAIRLAALMAILAVETGTVALAEVPGEDEGLNAVMMQAEHDNMVRRANAGASVPVAQTPAPQGPATSSTTASAPADPATKPGG